MKTSPKQLKTRQRAEKKRLERLVSFESSARANGYRFIAGLDEAGRGPLAGPVAAAACIIEEGVFFDGINDSKLLTPQKRKALYQALIEHQGVRFGIGRVEVDEIDAINIYQASLLAMRRALEALPTRPDYLLADAVVVSFQGIPCEKIIQGDRKSQSIAAASILAKETRDSWMKEYHALYSDYRFDEHKGYSTPEHLRALEKYGPCPIHRRSFEPVKKLLQSSLSS